MLFRMHVLVLLLQKNIDNTIENDLFIPFGSTEYDNPEVGEVVYDSGNEIRTRRWTWRQGENGKIDNSVKNIFIPMDAFSENKESMLNL